MMGDDQKWALLRGADLFVLPSFTENFGVAAAEALACGVPVITTKGTPWEELRTRQCGWWVDIGVEPLVAALREATELSDQERYEMGQRGRRLVEEKYSWPKIGRDMMAVYQWVLGQGPKPECVIPKS
jgi:glycosyltransferase involved in cell wall biosynthesis